MWRKSTRTTCQNFLLVFALVFSFILQIPQPELNLEYYTSLASDFTASTDKDAPLRGINIVVTGATSGLGLDLSKQLYILGGTIIAVGRSESKLAKLVEEVQDTRQEEGSNHDKRIITVLADLQDMESVSAAANAIKSKFKTIDYLINNAGMTQSLGKEMATPQGHDEVFAVNYLSHFLLTEKLLPNLKLSKLSKGPRIVQISSSMHNLVSGDDLVPSTSGETPVASLPNNKNGMKAYGNSKLAQIYHARSLTRKFGDSKKKKGDTSSSLKIVSVCPAWVATHIAGAGMKNILDIFAFQSNGYGLAPILFAMFHPDVGMKDGIYNDYVTNCSILSGNFFSVMEKIVNLAAPIPFFREALLLIGSGGILFLQKIFASVDFRPTGSAGYDVVKQDALYAWSMKAVQPWV
jgi:NAD(P)-dependent dehydrogenase (short-subunit alcohol dehydrogenase family)